MNKPTRYTEARIIPYEDQESINFFTECLCKNMLDSASHKILDLISSNSGEYSFRLHAITANNVPEIQSTEFRLVIEVQKITRCKNCIYHRNEGGGFCVKHPDCGDDDDWFCRDGKEKDEDK